MDDHCKNGETCMMGGCICTCVGCTKADEREFGPVVGFQPEDYRDTLEEEEPDLEDDTDE